MPDFVLPSLRLINERHLVNGKPTDTFADVVAGEGVVTRHADHRITAARAFECGVLYGRAEAAGVRAVPVKGYAGARPPLRS